MKTIKKVFLFLFVSVAMSLVIFQLDASERQPVINVSTVEQLYAAVNNARNVGATIHLAPGIYVLSASSPEGVPHPNHGALWLRPGMSLVGSEQRVDTNHDGVPDPVSPEAPDDFAVPGTETKIDGSGLMLPPNARKDCAGQVLDVGVSMPMISITRNNLISSLSLLNNDGPAISEVNFLKNFSVQIQSSVIESANFALGFGNRGCNAHNARSVLIFSNNVVRNASFSGLLILNAVTGDAANDPTNGPEIKATVSSNLFYNNHNGLVARAGLYGTDGGLIILEMTGNVFRNNGTNFQGLGGVGRTILGPTIGNRLHVTSRYDTFGEPSGSPSVFLIGGGEPSDGLGVPQHNRIEAEFIHSNFVRNKPARPKSPEISIIGGSDGGSDNHVTVLIRQATVQTSAGAPTSGTLLIQDETESGSAPNTARLRGSREAFMQSNQGFPAPEAKFFLKQ